MAMVIGYKATNADMTCRGYQYELGKKFIHEGEISLRTSGFHCCEVINRVFDYYSYCNGRIRLFEVCGTGTIEYDFEKTVCSEIEFIRELQWCEIIDMLIRYDQYKLSIDIMHTVIMFGNGYRIEECCNLAVKRPGKKSWMHLYYRSNNVRLIDKFINFSNQIISSLSY